MEDFTANVDGDLEKRLLQRDCQTDVPPNPTSGRFYLLMHLLVSQQGASKPGAETLHRSCCQRATHGEDSQQDLAGWEVEEKVFHRQMHVVSLLDVEETLVNATANVACV